MFVFPKCKNTKWCQTFQVWTFEVKRNLTENHWRRWTQRLRGEDLLNIKRRKNINSHFPSEKCSGFGWATQNFRAIARNSRAFFKVSGHGFSAQNVYTFICGIRRAVSLPVSYLRLFCISCFNYSFTYPHQQHMQLPLILPKTIN